MNRVININLGGMPFVIDDDAYEYMSNYLASIRNHFAFSASKDEIMYDIEVRMAELFQEKLRSRQIITQSELDAVIRIMGKPEDFGGEPLEDNVASDFKERRTSGEYQYIKPGKRLFRDKENKVVSGVCSGISAYLGIQDPIWVRLVFGGMMFLGFGFLLYFFLMIAVPYAKTSSDKLAMTGEPINIDNIARKVEEEIEEIGRKINNWGEDVSKYGREYDFTWGKKKEKEKHKREA
jgi:phage shock protein PspC (stress-responsive transcriptional regulator)